MSERDDTANKDDSTPPTIEFDTPDQPNSWVAEVARQRDMKRPPPPQSPKEQPNGRQQQPQ